jgi:glycosyltransferase involved in cell wall biosynthesis
MQKRALMLAYYFPPATSGGVPRTVKFAKYLREFGWESTVIAPNRNGMPGKNIGFGREVPEEAEIIRAGNAAQNPWLWRTLDRCPYLWRAFRKVRAGVEYPDIFRHWLTTALPEARRLLREGRHDVIFTTSPPVTSHCIALQLKDEFQIPWVADFRDPWTDNTIGYENPWRWRKRLDVRLERNIYQNADVIIANTPTNRRTMIAKHGAAEDKVVTITNGYDEHDFTGLTPAKKADAFRITYTGSFYASYNPMRFLEAFRRFLDRPEHPRAKLVLAGDACGWVGDHVKDPELLGAMEFLGRVPHHDACQLLLDSDLLLHVYPTDVPYSVPGKLYEYLRSGTPIIAVCDRPSEVSRILEETGRGRAFRHDEMDELAEYLGAQYASWPRGNGRHVSGVDERIQCYERRRLAERLAAIFDRLAEGRSR